MTGDGVVNQLALDEREAPVTLQGEDLDGDDIALEDYRGKPVVVVVWGSWCVECRAEQDEVNEAAVELEGTADFVGLNVREPSIDNARAFVRESGITYRSLDGNDGEALTALQGKLTPYTVPAFLVLDAEGRVAASVIGSLPSRLTMVELAEEVAAESADAASG